MPPASRPPRPGLPPAHTPTLTRTAPGGTEILEKHRHPVGLLLTPKRGGRAVTPGKQSWLRAPGCGLSARGKPGQEVGAELRGITLPSVFWRSVPHHRSHTITQRASQPGPRRDLRAGVGVIAHTVLILTDIPPPRPPWARCYTAHTPRVIPATSDPGAMYLPHPLWGELVVHQDLDHICGMSGSGHCNTEPQEHTVLSPMNFARRRCLAGPRWVHLAPSRTCGHQGASGIPQSPWNGLTTQPGQPLLSASLTQSSVPAGGHGHCYTSGSPEPKAAASAPDKRK